MCILLDLFLPTEIGPLMRTKKFNPALHFYKKTCSQKFYFDGISLYLCYYAVAHVIRGATQSPLFICAMCSCFETDEILESQLL